MENLDPFEETDGYNNTLQRLLFRPQEEFVAWANRKDNHELQY